ncbi:hypothetical protein OUZ56_021066 [Daphnia magna]|uniref:Uncharacterized protein n=1 Tax=Daphnia magna TaxID=35525 RepID=A0ABQ9ZH02_9CRUS|nr:hypothetical protein OUZ56_021066 [Daphnia magna]
MEARPKSKGANLHLQEYSIEGQRLPWNEICPYAKAVIDNFRLWHDIVALSAKKPGRGLMPISSLVRASRCLLNGIMHERLRNVMTSPMTNPLERHCLIRCLYPILNLTINLHSIKFSLSLIRAFVGGSGSRLKQFLEILSSDNKRLRERMPLPVVNS